MDTLNHHPIFHLFPKFENIVYSVRQVLPLWIQVVSFLQLPHSSLWPAGKHSCGKARQKRGEDHSKNQAKVVSKELSLCSGVHLQNMMGKISEKLVLNEGRWSVFRAVFLLLHSTLYGGDALVFHETSCACDHSLFPRYVDSNIKSLRVDVVRVVYFCVQTMACLPVLVNVHRYLQA